MDTHGEVSNLNSQPEPLYGIRHPIPGGAMATCQQCQATFNRIKSPFCQSCRDTNHRKYSREYQARMFGSGKRPKARHIDWDKADELLRQGMPDADVADACKCSTWSIWNRRKQKSHLRDSNYVLAHNTFDYGAKLKAWLDSVWHRAFQHMTRDQFQRWLKQDEGQAFLGRVNAAIATERMSERQVVDWSTGHKSAKRGPNL